MNATPFLLAAALTPRDQWHERWKYINRLAGVVAERSQWPPLHGADRGQAAQALVDEAAREFTAFLASQETDGVDVATMRTQERELYCAKKVWEVSFYRDGQESFRAKILTARNCDHFEEFKS